MIGMVGNVYVQGGIIIASRHPVLQLVPERFSLSVVPTPATPRARAKSMHILQLLSLATRASGMRARDNYILYILPKAIRAEGAGEKPARVKPSGKALVRKPRSSVQEGKVGG
jgi:hypothetical protein